MKANRYFLGICIFAAFSVNEMRGQDVHFSQFNETPQLLNPGATGVYNGYMRGIINYKNQWMAMVMNLIPWLHHLIFPCSIITSEKHI